MLGAAFMLVEVEMFQVFAMLIGHPAYTMAVVLGSLLVCSGMGSLQAKRLALAKPQIILSAFALLAALLMAFSFSKAAIFDVLIGFPFTARLLGTLAVIAPIGFLMGLPMATCMHLLQSRPGIMLWGWALNGALSVLASVLAVVLAINIGIAATFGIGAACYAGSGLLAYYLRLQTRDLHSAEADVALPS